MKIEVYYDKECPFCNYYANYLELKKEHELYLYNARKKNNKIEEFRQKGFDINDGFIINIDEKKLYQGSKAIIFLNKLSSKKFYFPNNFFFKKIIYPIIKSFRIFVLKLMGKETSI